jgi:hypothetical protein
MCIADDVETNQERQVLQELRLQRSRMHPLARAGERLDDVLSVAIDRTVKHLGLGSIHNDDAAQWSATIGAAIVAMALLIKDGELE